MSCYYSLYGMIYRRINVWTSRWFLLSSEKRINEILDLVNQNLDEKEMMKALKEIRYRDNIPYEH